MVHTLSNERGLIALISVLIITAIAIGVSTSSALSGVSASQMILKRVKSDEALALATSCAEEALLRLKNNFTYTLAMRESISFGSDGSCDIVSVSGITEKEIRTEAVRGLQLRRVKIFVSRPGANLVIDSWQEVADF
jgi:hypothetical protein